ncbi:MAG: citrate synthase [Gemmataceae bacterium]
MTGLPFVRGLEKVPAAESAVSFIDGEQGRLEYRGIPIEDLALHSTYEETAWLLLEGRLPSQKELADFDARLKQERRIKYKLKDLIKCMPEGGHPMDALQASVAAMAMYYPMSNVNDEDKNWEAVVRLIAKMPTLVAAFHRLRQGEDAVTPREDLDHASNFYYMLFEKDPSPGIRKVIDACLILHAEHTMNASTFTARVTGSTLSTPYAVVSSAIGSLHGPLHGGANERVLETLDQIGSVENVRSWAEDAIANKKKIMGFGHRVYKTKDPRAKALHEFALQALSEQDQSAQFQVAMELEKVVAEKLSAKGIYPNVDFFSGIVYQALGIPRDLFTPIFAIARVSGWLSHWLEQLEGNRIFRPSQVFVGERDKKYIPLEQRA